MPQEKPIWRKAKLEMSAYGDAAHELDFSETLLIRYDARELERILSGWKSWVASEPMGAAIQSGEAKLESMEWAWGDEGKKPRWADLGKENPREDPHAARRDVHDPRGRRLGGGDGGVLHRRPHDRRSGEDVLEIHGPQAGRRDREVTPWLGETLQ